jgi:YbbR domain-containing protein
MRWLTTNTGLKVVSLILATVTWYFVRSITNDTRTMEGVPLDIKVKPGTSLLSASARQVNVVVSGTREDVRQVYRYDLSAVLDLSREDRTGELDVPLGVRAVRHPSRVQVVQVAPSSITVRIDQLVERELTVKPDITGELPSGFVIERILVRPQNVPVKGPKLLLDKLTAMDTLPIDVTGRRTSFREWVDLALTDPNIAPTQRRWVEVDVRIAESPAVDSGSGAGVQKRP